MGLKKMSNTSNQGKGLNGMEVMVLIYFCPGHHERQRQWGRLAKRDLIKIVASYNRGPTFLKDRIRVNPYHSATRFNLVGTLLQNKYTAMEPADHTKIHKLGRLNYCLMWLKHN